ncbi:sensor histidine kinase [Paenibacillus sp. TAB 01]|uniref:sensor histidine kinase n=1 Tax=Paenibacillus sp. TAB 01 TaxID=3368988 RepID=UPI00375363B8
MEFTALQSQLNPHFLFNTLETINWKAISITHKPSVLNTMVENLADILKYSLDGHHRMVILQMEIKYTKSYIDIQKVRYADQFQLIWEYNEEVHKYHVMKLILQPLIENSLYHGIREKGTPGLIKIKIRIIQSHLTLSIIDNGLGMKPEKLSELRANLDKNYEKSKHIGLYNTHKRLKLTYGEQYGVVVRSKFGWGTAVHISIPIH